MTDGVYVATLIVAAAGVAMNLYVLIRERRRRR